ncbi:MAG TPA: DUF4960 domain-containing protein [Bacteroidota bacterium]
MIHLGFLFDYSAGLSPEELAARKFLSSRRSVNASHISFQSLNRKSTISRLPPLLWWHFDSSTTIPGCALNSRAISRLRSYVYNGGSLLLSLLAAQYVVDLGIEELRPNTIGNDPWGEDSWAPDYPDIRGVATYLGHPIYHGLPGGVYTWDPQKGDNYAAAIYEGIVPGKGRVVGVERQYIKINESRRIVTEYELGKGRILSIGTHLFFNTPRHRFRPNLERFTANCLEYLSRQSRPSKEENRTYWTFDPRTVVETKRHSKRFKPRSSLFLMPDENLSIKRDVGPDDQRDQYFDVGGRRILIAGKERGGIAEIWCHPFRIVKSLRVAFKVGNHASCWSHELHSQFTARPECVSRKYSIHGAMIEEIVFGDRKRPGGAVCFRSESKEPVEITVTITADLRLMWPLSDEATGSLQYAWDDGLHAAVITAPHPNLAVVIGCSVSPDEHLVGQYSSFDPSKERLVGKHTDELVVGVGIRVRLTASRGWVSLCFSGSHLGEPEAERTYRAIVAAPDTSFKTQTTHVRTLLAKSTQVSTPDPKINEAFRWALISTDRFFADVPGVGSSLFAGFGSTEQGWNGGHAISGRPGYAWYFGRDSVWTSFALLGYGDFENVKSVLEFLGSNQDPSGKIPHEVTTSGFAHYDAADATPLYIILMGKYIKASGDISFARKHFDRLLNAVEFCFSTDTDGDHLIENTNVGHGWVEGGQLFPVHTEHYLASCWAKALEEAAFVASTLRKKRVSEQWKKESARVAGIVRKEFWNERTQFYNFGRMADGTFNEQKTLLPAVGISFGIAREPDALKCLEAYATDKFSADWGTRIIGTDNPMYKPTGYHYGSVWPLFTGWTSMAEFTKGRPIQGFVHAMNNLLLYDQFAAGAIEEVLDGDRFQPAGVCPHQGWSESMAIQPILEGMLGLNIDTVNAAVSLRPYFPPNWDFTTVSNVRIGRRRLRVTMRRESGSTEFTFEISQGKPLTFSFRPYFALGTKIFKIEVNRSREPRRPVTIKQYGDCPIVVFKVSNKASVRFGHTGGVAVVPPVPRPLMMKRSQGLRLIREEWVRGKYVLTTEGQSGSTENLTVICEEDFINSDDGCFIEGRTGNCSTVRLSFPGLPGSQRYERKTVALSTKLQRSQTR